MTIDNFLAKLECVKTRGANRWSARCPAHPDKNPSLSLAVGHRGILARCWAGCSLDSIAAALGLQVRDLFFDARWSTGQMLAWKKKTHADRLARDRATHTTGLLIDARREAEQFLVSCRGLDISTWTDAELENNLTIVHAAYLVLENDHYANTNNE